MEALFSGQGSLDGNDQAGGILPSNKDFRPTQGAIRHSEDTEFNDALRARGIIPQKPSTQDNDSQDYPIASRAEQLQDRIDSSNLSDDEDLLALEDEDIPSSILEKYRSQRMNEVQKLQKSRRYGSLLPIGREDYTREINEASEEDVQGDYEELVGKGTGVIAFLWKEGIPESELMSRHLKVLANAYPSSKFVSIRGEMCIPNYPDKNIPTLLLYRKGKLIKQIVGMGELKGMRTAVQDVEGFLTIYDAIDPLLKVAATAPVKSQDSDSEDEGRQRRSNGLRQTLPRGGRGDSDDELDL